MGICTYSPKLDSYGNYIYGDMELNEIYCYGIKQEKSNRDFLLQSARGIDIKALGTTAADDINIIAESSINITAKETVSNAIDITATNGGINILSTGTNLGDDIDITSTTSINLIANEDIPNAFLKHPGRLLGNPVLNLSSWLLALRVVVRHRGVAD